MEQESKANWNPETLRPWMVNQGYAKVNQGTTWSGITETLKYIGHKNVVRIWDDPMSEAWKELDKGNRIGVLLVDNGYTPDGTYWTSSGHYVAFTDYRKDSNGHWFYIKDSGGRNHDGWFCYEKSIKNALPKVWIVERLGKAPTPTPDDGHYPGEYPAPSRYLEKGDKGTEVGKLQDYLNWYTNGKFYKECGGRDNIFGSNTDKYVKAMQTDFFGASEADGKVGNKTISKMRTYSKKDPKPTPTPTKKPYTGEYPNPKKYLEFGDKGTEVGKLQDYLNWYTDGAFYKECGGRDNIYGKNTLKYCNQMLTDFFGASEANGEVGAKTIAKMKEYGANPNPQPVPPTPTTYTNVIDVSAVQDSINWASVKASGIVGVMVRCGYRGYETGNLNEDKMFLNHIKGAYNAGLKVGVYFFTEALNWAEGKEEAEFTLKLIEKSGVNLYYPIAVDTEAQSASTERAKNLSKAQRTDAIKGFCETIKERGGQPMIYASLLWFDNKLDMSKLPYDIWCAQYHKECQYKGKYLMWQYTSEGSVEGVKGVVDMNKSYITSPAPMPKPTPTPSGGYTGSFPTEAEIRSESNAGIHEGIRAWCKKIADSGEYGYKSFTDDPATQICPICNNQPKKYWGWNCIGYAFASWRHGGGIPSTCNCGVIWNGLGDNYYYWPDADVLASMKSRIGINDIKMIRNGNNAIPPSALLKGDLLMYYNGNEYAHMAVYIGNGEISDDSGGQNPDIKYGKSYDYSKYRKCLFAIRYTGTRSFIKIGDEGTAVLKWQDFLNWWSDGQFYKECGTGDGIFGANTHKWSVAFQEKEIGKGQGDGLVGQKTISVAKTIKK
jgi:GH25 family lysozyme M1 (1,4-beta-N-acetylmuramidase)